MKKSPDCSAYPATPNSLAINKTCPLISPLATPSHLPFPHHVHDLESLEGSPRGLDGKEAHPRFREAFDEPMVLLNEIAPVFDLPQFDSFWKDSSGFQISNRFGVGCVFIQRPITRGTNLLVVRSAGASDWLTGSSSGRASGTEPAGPCRALRKKRLAASASRVGFKRNSSV
jgi:hypothetical protein